MNLRKLFTPLLAFTLVGAVALVPMNASAQNTPAYKHRQQTKNTWRNIGYGSAALGAYGLISGNRNLTLLGAAGAGYSAYRYEHDRKSQRSMKDAYYARRYSRYGMRTKHRRRVRRHRWR